MRFQVGTVHLEQERRQQQCATWHHGHTPILIIMVTMMVRDSSIYPDFTEHANLLVFNFEDRYGPAHPTTVQPRSSLRQFRSSSKPWRTLSGPEATKHEILLCHMTSENTKPGYVGTSGSLKTPPQGGCHPEKRRHHRDDWDGGFVARRFEGNGTESSSRLESALKGSMRPRAFTRC